MNVWPTPASRLSDDFDQIADVPGVYLVYVRNGIELLERSAYFELASPPPLATPCGCLLYAGATGCSLRSRIRQHLSGDSRVSTIRRTTGAILGTDLCLQAYLHRQSLHYGAGEDRLTRWLNENLLFDIRPTDDPFGTERVLLSTLTLPFNITRRRNDPYSGHLMELREEAKAKAIYERRRRSGFFAPGDETQPIAGGA